MFTVRVGLEGKPDNLTTALCTMQFEARADIILCFRKKGQQKYLSILGFSDLIKNFLHKKVVKRSSARVPIGGQCFYNLKKKFLE